MGRMTAAALGLALGTGAAGAEALSVAGRQIAVAGDGMGSAALVVDGAVLHEDGVIYLDAPQVVDGVTVVTGAAGAGGNACNAAPFVLALPEGRAAEFWGPVESCASFSSKLEEDRILFASDALPGSPGESWVWTPVAGFQPGPAVGFVSQGGWEAFDRLAGAHPAEALAVVPVLERLQAGLGAEFPTYAGLIGGLGSGDLTAEGYLGRACDKLVCETDWAVLYLHRATEGVFAVWQSGGAQRHWPEDRALWPAEALAVLDGDAAE